VTKNVLAPRAFRRADNFSRRQDDHVLGGDFWTRHDVWFGRDDVIERANTPMFGLGAGVLTHQRKRHQAG
jgi:hypothetical protein